MRVLWKQGPLLANEIADILGPITQWNHRTVKTLLGRLVQKGAITYKKIDHRYLYRPAIDEKTCVHGETRSFMDRYYGGALMPMLAAFLENQKFTAQEIEELKALLEKGKEH